MPDDLKPLVNDCRVNVFELGWLTEEQEALFRSDFKHVVHYLRQVRIGKERRMLPDPLTHAPELLTLMKALAKDDRYDEFIRQAKIKQERGETMTFPSIVEDAENRANEATVRRLLKLGKLTLADIAEAVGFQLSDVQSIAKELGLAPAV